MMLLMFLAFIFQQDSIYQSFKEQIQLGNFATAHNVLSSEKFKKNLQLQEELLSNVLNNNSNHSKFTSFYLEDTERIPPQKASVNMNTFLKGKHKTLSIRYNFQLYEYLSTLPPLRKIEKKKKSIISYLSKNNAYNELYHIALLNKNLKSTLALKKFVKEVTPFEDLNIKTSFFKKGDTETKLLNFLQLENISDLSIHESKMILTDLLLEKGENERAQYYFDQIDELLVNRYQYIKLQVKISKAYSETFFKDQFLAHFHDHTFYSGLESFLMKKHPLKRIPVELIWYNKKAPNTFSKIHITYLLYKAYKRQLPSRTRNKYLKKYSDLCYKLLKKLYKV